MKNIFGQPSPSGGMNPQIDIPMDFGSTFQGNPPQVNFAQPPITIPESTPMMQEPTGYDIGSRMKELYNPETMAGERFNRLIGEQPQYEKPGVWRSIAAALSAFGPGGHETGMRVANEPYTRKMETWKNAIGPAQAAANLERQENVNERTLAYQTVSQELRQQADEARAANDTRRSDIAQQRANVYEFKARNPNLKFNFSGPTVLATDPTSGRVTDTGVQTGNLSAMDKMNLAQEQALERIEKTGQQARTTEEKRQEGRMEVVGERGEQARRTKETPTATQTGRGELPTQTKVRQYNAAKQLANTRPELRQFIKLGTSNDFTIEPPGTNFFGRPTGPTKEQYDEINAAIYGAGPQIQQPNRIKTEAKVTAPTNVRVRNAQGQTGTFKGTAEEARKAGFTVIE